MNYSDMMTPLFNASYTGLDSMLDLCKGTMLKYYTRDTFLKFIIIHYALCYT